MPKNHAFFYIQESLAGMDKIDTAYLVGNVSRNLIKVTKIIKNQFIRQYDVIFVIFGYQLFI